MKISIITPSLNQGSYIEDAIRSVLDQRGDFELEYLVVDGLSTDSTIDVLKQHEAHLEWVSEKDDGQSDAINKGFHRATGDVLAWLNSDDVYAPGALAAVAAAYGEKPFGWCFGDCRVIDEKGTEIRQLITRYKISQCRRYSFRRLLRRNFISQPATFFSRDALTEVGDLDTDMEYSMDYDYFLRFAGKYEPRYIERHLADFRWHSESKSDREAYKTARVAYECARKHAPKGTGWDLFLHWVHYHLQTALYSII